jgi:predicted DNA-binding transcriptional regulator YafY
VSKVERLLNLTMALLGTPRPLTATDLRDRVPGYPDTDASFRRAFERDKDALREMGIPLTRVEIPFTDPPTEGYRIAEDDYYLRDPGFEPDELAALHLAASVARLDAGDGREALWKLGGMVAGADDVGLPDPAAEALVEVPNDANLAPLFSAAVDRRRVELTYRATRRRIDPHRLDFRRGRWYLTGFDHHRGEERNFRLDRIDGDVAVVGAAGAFDRPSTAVPGGPAEPWQFREEDPVTARLLVDADHAVWVRRHLGTAAGAVALEERDDGSVVADVVVTNWPAFRSFVLTFLEHAEVLEPPALRADLVAWLERSLTGAPAESFP